MFENSVPDIGTHDHSKSYEGLEVRTDSDTDCSVGKPPEPWHYKYVEVGQNRNGDAFSSTPLRLVSHVTSLTRTGSTRIFMYATRKRRNYITQWCASRCCRKEQLLKRGITILSISNAAGKEACSIAYEKQCCMALERIL